MDTQFIPTVRLKMHKALQILHDDLGTIRTGRATPALVENILVSVYEGTQHLKIKELATITTEGPKNLLIAPFDPSIVVEMEKGLNSANLGFTASTDSNVIRINLPPLTSERRDEFIKLAHTKIEGGRIMVRQIRHEAMTDTKKAFEAKTISEDDKKRFEKEVQTLTDEIMAEIELLREKKEQELREV